MEALPTAPQRHQTQPEYVQVFDAELLQGIWAVGQPERIPLKFVDPTSYPHHPARNNSVLRFI